MHEDIQHSFEHFSEKGKGQCHIYSYPFTIGVYPNIANNFPGGLFICVSEISLFDEHPFEHEFFVHITESFPLLKRLTIQNEKPQCAKSKNIYKNLLIIQYPHLENLHFKRTHGDYIEQFLIDTKTDLPSNVTLCSDYKFLKRLTHQFTRNPIRLNCGKMEYVCSERIIHFPKHFQNYFFKTDIRML